MTRIHLPGIAALSLGLFFGCRESSEPAEPTLPADESVATTSGSGDRSAGEGTLRVLGEGIDLYHVFDAAGEKKIDFTATGKALELHPGAYTVELNGIRTKAAVAPGQETTLPSGKLVVSGIGQDLYELYDETGQRKLNFKTTNGPMELFGGDYVVKLHGVSKAVTVPTGKETTIPTGTLTVPGDGSELYEVFDEAGAAKLDFTSTGKLLELLPGIYTVRCSGQEYTAVARPGEQTTVSPASRPAGTP